MNVTYLLAVWGEKYIRQFMDLSLRTLLAPGNIPGLARETRSTFIFLTRTEDRGIFISHPLFRRLEHECRVQFVPIDDLMFGGNYSATLTIAYERGMRSTGAAMLSTYFIYLVADYIMADGSLQNLLPYMRRGVSGITTGNFQATEEDMIDTFRACSDPNTGAIAIQPRELMAMTLPHLHPLAVANTVTQDLSHNHHTNRLFWQVDGETMIGRFYLRHMIAIRPEIDDYVIGAACDYSYIPEMCPSGNVVHIMDSDEYCVVELQPFGHEQQFIRPGPFREPRMAQSLGEWVTKVHRANALYPVVYHAGEIPAAAQAAIDQSGAMIDRLETLLPDKAQPVRGHPYWISCIEGILEHITRSETLKDHYRKGVFAGIIGSAVFEPPLGESCDDYHLLKKLRYSYGNGWRFHVMKLIRAVYGEEAHGRPWHRDYAHARAVNKAIAKAAAGGNTFMVIAHQPTSYANWCHHTYGKRAVLQNAALFDLRPVEVVRRQAQGASQAVILVPLDKLDTLGQTLAKCNACLTGDKRVTVVVTQKFFGRRVHFRQRIAALAAYCGHNTRLESFMTVSNPLRRKVDPLYCRMAGTFMAPGMSPVRLVKRAIAAAVVFSAQADYAIGNLLSRIRPYPQGGNPTCAIMTLRLLGENRITLHCERNAREEHHDND